MSQEFQEDNVVITDTSCFILLDKIDAFPIFNKLYRNVITTPEIAQEFGKPLPAWIKIRSASNQDLQLIYSQKVDIGEASAIVLALETDKALLIIDEMKGRRLAAELHLNYTGTLGVLILAKQLKIITELRPYFEKIVTTNFRISRALLEKVLLDAGE